MISKVELLHDILVQGLDPHYSFQVSKRLYKNALLIDLLLVLDYRGVYLTPGKKNK